MSRPKSAVLSAADQKAVVANLKSKIKSTAAEIKAVLAGQKSTEKSCGTTIKAAEKLYAAEMKTSNKALTVLNKDLTSLQAQLVAMTPPKADLVAPVAPSSVMRKPRNTKAAISVQAAA